MFFFDYLGLSVHYFEHALSRIHAPRPPVGDPRQKVDRADEHGEIYRKIKERADGHFTFRNH